MQAVFMVLLGISLTACATNPVCRNVPESQAWVRTELYFGLAKPDGSHVTESEYQRFLDTEVTPRFSAGFTSLNAGGQYRGANGVIVKEPSRALILFYPFDRNTVASVDEIRGAFQASFQQEAVLRADTMTCVAL